MYKIGRDTNNEKNYCNYYLSIMIWSILKQPMSWHNLDKILTLGNNDING